MNFAVTIFVILISTYIVNASLLDPVIENVVHLQAKHPPSGVPGVWKKKTIWKSRWVKEWKSAKVMKPVWKKVWSPVHINEWVPIPKPPPGWEPNSTPLKPVPNSPSQSTDPITEGPALPLGNANTPTGPGQNTAFYPVGDTHLPSVPNSAPLPLGNPNHQGPQYGSPPHTIANTNLQAGQLWDPVPYPESQQPPPPSTPYYPPCRADGCGTPTFNQEQISGIIGAHKYHQHETPEYSESVTHLTRVPPNGANWRQPQQSGFNNQYNSGFSAPPKFSPTQHNNFRNHHLHQQPRYQNHNAYLHQNHNTAYSPQNQNTVQPHQNHNTVQSHQNHNHNYQTQSQNNYNIKVSHSPSIDISPSQNNGYRHWTPLPPNTNHNQNSNNGFNQGNNNVNGHFITKAPDHPYKFVLPDPTTPPNVPTNSLPNTHQNGNPNDLIQQAELVGEYHYSDFDLTKIGQPAQQTATPAPPPPPTSQPHLHQQPQRPHNVPQNRPLQKPPQGPSRPKHPPPNRPQIQQNSARNNNTPTQRPQQQHQQREQSKQNQPTIDSRPRQVRTESPGVQSHVEIYSFTSRPNTKLQLEKAISQDIFPIFKPLPSLDPFPSNHKFEPLKDNNVDDGAKSEISQQAQPQPKPLIVEEVVTEGYNTSTPGSSDTTTPYTVYPSSSLTETTETSTQGSVYIVTPSYTAKS